jgi:hypothetical protein
MKAVVSIFMSCPPFLAGRVMTGFAQRLKVVPLASASKNHWDDVMDVY